MLETFTRALMDLGFAPETSGDGLQHRWRRHEAEIDVLLPEGIGERLAARVGSGVAPTLTTPGGTQALGRSEPVKVRVDGRTGTILRPSLVGALIIKAAAHTVPEGRAKGRHRLDFATLSELLSRTDFSADPPNATERRRLRDMVDACRADVRVMARPGAELSLARLERAAGLG